MRKVVLPQDFNHVGRQRFALLVLCSRSCTGFFLGFLLEVHIGQQTCKRLSIQAVARKLQKYFIILEVK